MTVRRFDLIDPPEYATTAFEKTPEGYLKGRATITNIGVFPYRKADGSIDWELRHPDDVFAVESMETYKMKPITMDHPEEMVDANNIEKYQIGNTGEFPINVNDMYLANDLIVQKKEAVDAILNGKIGLSCGYSCDVLPENGVWLGMPYTSRQKNIRLNHLAVCDFGRAGETARIRLDSADAIMVSAKDVPDTTPVVVEDKNTKEGGTHMADLKKIKLDGVIEYEVADEVASYIGTINEKNSTLQVSLDTLNTEKSTIEAERDTLKDRVDALKKELDETKASKMDEVAIKAAVARRVKLLDAANKAEVEVKEDMDEMAIQKAIILKVFPGAQLKDDAVYIEARFDGAIETLEAQADAIARGAENHEEEHKDSAPKTADKAREAYINRLTKKE